MGDSGPRKEDIPGIPRRRREALLGRSSRHPLQNPPQVISIFAQICAFTRKFRGGSSRLRGIQLTCSLEPSPRLKREKSGASLGPASYLVSGSGPRRQHLLILRATSPHWQSLLVRGGAGPAARMRHGLPSPPRGVPGTGCGPEASRFLRRSLFLPGFPLWLYSRAGVCCLLPDPVGRGSPRRE